VLDGLVVGSYDGDGDGLIDSVGLFVGFSVGEDDGDGEGLID